MFDTAKVQLLKTIPDTGRNIRFWIWMSYKGTFSQFSQCQQHLLMNWYSANLCRNNFQTERALSTSVLCQTKGKVESNKGERDQGEGEKEEREGEGRGLVSHWKSSDYSFWKIKRRFQRCKRWEIFVLSHFWEKSRLIWLHLYNMLKGTVYSSPFNNHFQWNKKHFTSKLTYWAV